jgi:serine/threonine protein kinase/tetratricopeptide (TPR) repeat protein
MNTERWDAIAEWFSAWLAADAGERERLRARLAAERPDLVADADALLSSSGRLEGFLETPALVLAAQEVAQEDSLLLPGSMVGPYRVASLIARGGMGDVYRATDVRLQRDVALKVLAQTKTGDPLRVERFMHEARVTAALDHPNVVRVYDVGQQNDRAYLVAELLEGETLRTRIARGPIPADEAVRIGIEIARGLVAAHTAGLVHRDLKPDNIYLTQPGVTKILDFGIAKLAQDETVRDGFSTLTGVVLGTAGYLSPEQIKGETIDARADLFALGAVLFEMLTGTRAFARPHLVETLHAILHDSPAIPAADRADVSPAFGRIVMRLLEKSPDARFGSATDVIAALEGVQATTRAPWFRIPWMRRSNWPTDRSRTRQRRWVVAAAALAVIGLAALSAWRFGGTSTATTLAIMPFRTVPAASENDVLELGLAEVLISRLSQLPDVSVLPLSRTQRQRQKEPAQAARELGADRVLTVTLLRGEGKVRATPQLLSASGESIWSTSIDEDETKIFLIQDLIVTKVIEALSPGLSPSRQSRVLRSGTRNDAAFQAYVRGRRYVFNPGPDLHRARDAFEEAVRLDPEYADAWAGLGSAYKRMPVAGGVPAPEAFPRAKEAANKARALDQNHAEAMSVLGTVAFWHDWDYGEAERLLRTALQLRPSDADAELFLGHLLANLGRFDEALESIRRARGFDPEWPLARAHEGHFLYMARQYDRALEHLAASVKIAPQFWPARNFLVFTLLALGKYDDAIQHCDALAQLRQGVEADVTGGGLPFKGYAYARMGRRTEAEQVLEQFRRAARVRLGMGEPMLLHALGRDDEAMDVLERQIERRDQTVTFLGVYPVWDDLRDSPRFQKILQSIHMLDVSNRMPRR